MTLVYLDSSAVVKLALKEKESDALVGFISGENPTGQQIRMVSCDLTRTETLLACRRVSEVGAQRARLALRLLTSVRISTTITDLAGLVDPPALRSLDSLHLTTALHLSPELFGVITYDDRFGHAARNAGLDVFQPA